jgi:RNA polymerase sigma-70 factor (ECF subfamily)
MAVHDHDGLLTDEALLHNIAHGCEDCFELLFMRFFRPVSNLAKRILNDRFEAEDVAQEVFLAIHNQRERFDPGLAPAHTWILQFAYYKSLKRRRYLSNRHFYDKHISVEDDGDDPLFIEPPFAQTSVEFKALIAQAFASITPAQRGVIEKVYFEGRTLREISQIERKHLAGIRNSYYRGINALRLFLTKGVRASHDRGGVSTKGKPEYEIKL